MRSRRVMEFPSVILLDLDDTILALSSTSDPCWRRICERYARQIDGLTADQLFDAIKVRRDHYWDDPERHKRGRADLKAARREVVAGAFSDLGLNASTLAIALADAFTAEREEALHPLPGAIEALQRLKNRGIRLGLVTNGTTAGQRQKIERFDLSGFFEHIFIEGEMGMGKPDVRVFERALEEFGVDAEDAWMVGDNLVWDVEAPQKLGIFSIWIDLSGQGVPDSSSVKPDRAVRGLIELVENS